MDGENNGKPYEQMDDVGVYHPYFWKHPYADVRRYIYPTFTICFKPSTGRSIFQSHSAISRVIARGAGEEAHQLVSPSIPKNRRKSSLVGGFNPFEKY